MKKIVFIMAFALISTFAFAQRGHHGFSINKLTESLDLTTAQLDEITELKIEAKEKIQIMRSAETRPTHQERSAFKKSYKEKMLAILTPSQAEKWEALKMKKRAHRSKLHEAHKTKHQEVWTKLKAYHQSEMLPTLIAQRAKLDKEISRKDKKEIEKLRTIISNFKAERKATHESRKEARQLDAEPRKRRGHHHHKRKGRFAAAFQETYPVETAKLKTLEQKYAADIAHLMDEIADERADWKTKKEETRQSLKDYHKEKREAYKRRQCKENCEKNGDYADRKAQFKEREESVRRIRFLLLDPSKNESEQVATLLNQKAVAHNTKVFPNPATNQQTIEFDVAQNGNVLVEIIDKNGQVLQLVHNGNMTQGLQSISVDISSLKGYVFYYRITDATGISSTKFLTKN